MWPRLFLSASLSVSLISFQRGDALFNGRGDVNGRNKEVFHGRIREHDDDLPPETVRCVNCHGASGASLTGKGAPHLDRAFLEDFRQRRGGPPSRYDQPAFCKLLRTGVDPAHILIAREMPTYTIDEAQCASLWLFLLGSKDKGDSPQKTAKRSNDNNTDQQHAQTNSSRTNATNNNK